MPKYPATSKYDESGYAPPLEPGEYLISLATVRETDEKGAFIVDRDGFRFSLFEFEVDGQPNRLFDRFCFDEKYPYANVNLGKFKQLLVAIGGNPDKEGDTDWMLGKTCIAVVKTREHKDKTYNNIVTYKSSGGQPEIKGKDDDSSLPF